LIHPISTASEASHGSYNAHVRVVSILVMKIETEQLQLEVRRGVVELGDALLERAVQARKVEATNETDFRKHASRAEGSRVRRRFIHYAARRSRPRRRGVRGPSLTPDVRVRTRSRILCSGSNRVIRRAGAFARATR
jgi:hypothetical protein